MKSKKIFYSVALSLLALLTSFIGVQSKNELKINKIPGKTFSDTLDISAYKGKVVIINFWASWSKASRAENKNVARVYDKYRQISKLVFISVSLDTDEKAWKSAIDEDEMVWPNHICDFKKYASPIAQQYGVFTLPKLILIDKLGNVHSSSAKMSDIESAIDLLLK
ncbi:MAG: TlpA family protein disulfide reductase [Bacteroidia bacterium]|nr:TlpA family protein disulfide reductase [Bacteroidia bacterium]